MDIFNIIFKDYIFKIKYILKLNKLSFNKEPLNLKFLKEIQVANILKSNNIKALKDLIKINTIELIKFNLFKKNLYKYLIKKYKIKKVINKIG